MATRHSLLRCFLLAAVVASAIGCATPAPIVRLTPRNPNDLVWVSGRAGVFREHDGVVVAAAFDHQAPRMLGLRVEVQNLSDDEVEVDPDDFTFTTCAGEPAKRCAPGHTVINPERMLARLDRQRAREEADASNERAFLTPFLILGAIADVASIPSGEHRSQADSVANDMDRNDARHAAAVSQIGTERQRWSDLALRRTTLYPGQTIAGYVYIPIDRRARFVWLQVRTGDRQFPFCFRQEVERVRRS